jgi:aspartyl-tRNA synthetase
MKTGTVEVKARQVAVFNTCRMLPFSLEDEREVDEALRLRYRYLDLRRPTLQGNLVLRHRVTKMTRDYFDARGFLEIETPFLTRSTPEGARDYLVPSRVTPGAFYALPQSPQLFKQMLMIGGMDRYFQIARCFRDEDLRADRQPEFTQVDVEMSFVEQEEILSIMEEWVSRLFRELLGKELPRPFPRMKYEEAMESYGADNPDTRFPLLLTDVTDAVRESSLQIFQQVVREGGVIKAFRFPGGARLSRREVEALDGLAKEWGAGGLIWGKCSDQGFQSPVAKFLTPEMVESLFLRTEAGPGDLLLLMAGVRDKVNLLLGRLRLEVARQYGLIDPRDCAFVWVLDFPLFERDGEGRIASKHHPFTAPRDEDLALLESEPERCRSQAYDLVMNGIEIGGGSIRIHREDVQNRIFSVLGVSPEEAVEKFGFLLEALSLGAPPHGGIAFGLDRLTMLLSGAGSLREVIAFPKTQKAGCLLTRSPAAVDPEQLKELNIRLVSSKPHA